MTDRDKNNAQLESGILNLRVRLEEALVEIDYLSMHAEPGNAKQKLALVGAHVSAALDAAKALLDS